MDQSNSASNKSWNSSVRYLPWLPLPIFLVTMIILAIYRSEVIWNPPILFAALNIIFLSIIMFFVSILAIRSYQTKNSIVILLLGSGTLALGLGALLAGLSILGNNVNSTVTIYNTSACISAVFILTSAVLSIKMSLKTFQSKWLILVSYLGIIALITLVALLVRNHIWPVYFVQGTGPTAVDLTVLYTTITFFAISALLLVTYRIKDVLNFRIWYGLGLGLIALGLFSVSIQMNVGDPLNWMGRISQYLGSVYILIAIILSFRETGIWMLPWEQALFESETKYQRIVETANEGIMITDLDGVITFVNKKMADMLGYNDHELIDKSSVSLVDPSFQDKSHERIENRKEGIKEEYELKFLKKDGSHLWTHVSAAPLYDYTDQNIGILAMFVDNTKRKKIEEDLRKSEAKYHSLYASMKEGLAIHDIIYNSNHEPVDYLITDVNPSYEKIIGLSKNDVVGKRATEIYELEEPPYLEIYSKVAETGEPQEFETHFEPMGIYFNISVISPEKGKFVTVFEDITERKQNEKYLLESEEKYRSIIDNIQDAYVREDSNGIVTMTSPSAARMYRYNSPQDMIGIPALSLYKYPTDRDFMIEDINAHGKVEDYESAALRKDGSFFPVSLNAQYYYDANGQIQGTEAFIRDITDRKQIEAALKKSENSLAEAQRVAHIGSWEWNILTGEIVWSAELYNIYRVDPDTFVPDMDSFANYVHPDDREYVNEITNQIISEDKSVNFEFRIILNDGSTRILNTQAEITDHDENGNPSVIVGINQDITERKKAEEEIHMRRELLSAINTVFEESLQYETEGEVVQKYLDVAQTLTKSAFGFYGGINTDGRLDDRALSAPAWDVCETPNAIELLKNMEIVSYWGRVIKEEKSQIVNDPDSDPDRRGLPEGHPPITSFLGVPLRQGEKIIGMTALANKKPGYTETDKSNLEALSRAFVEVLMRKKVELEIKENLKQLAQSNKELEQFAYITSHDLREPLRMITSFLQLLERRYKDRLDQDANEFIEFAVNGAKRLDAMTNDLLQYSRITSEKREVTPVDFEKVLEEAKINLKVPIEENNAIITHDPLPTINGDEKLKVQLFQNIIGNAIKYRSEKTPKIHISAKKEKDYYIFSIKDNGIGMSPGHLERIFTIFQRLHTHDEYEGTGIGLAIAQKIVHQQGGEIWAESEPGKGTTFYFTILINPDPLSQTRFDNI